MPQFSISSVEQVLSYVIRITFTDIPYVYSTTTTEDAANIQNYSLVGPNNLYIDSIMPTEGDSYSVDLFLSDDISKNENWTKWNLEKFGNLGKLGKFGKIWDETK